MFSRITFNSFINFLSSLFRTGKFLNHLLPVSLTAADKKKVTVSCSCRQTGFGVLFIILQFCLALSYANGQNVNVAGALSGNGSYATLSAAFNAINGGSQNGTTINITITGNTTEPINGAVLFEGAWNSLSIKPSGTRVVSGAINPGLPLIDLNGADKITIDGLNSGGNSLTLTNTTVSSILGTSTVSFRNDAINNNITRCSVLGSSTDISSSANILFNTASVSGNNNNVISYCDIGPAGSNLPASAVTSSGTNNPSLFNKGDTIRNCNVYDYCNASAPSTGIYLTAGSSDFVIKENKFYQTSSRNIASPNHSAVYIDNTSGNNFRITGNIIGYSSSNGTGTYSLSGAPGTKFNPIYLSVGTNTATNVNANIIAGITMSGFTSGVGPDAPFIGIMINAGVAIIGSDSGNVIGNLTTTGNINFNTNTSLVAEVVGIYAETSTGCAINNNLIGSITSSNVSTGQLNIIGIRHRSPNSPCQNNIVGGTIANSIQTMSNIPSNTIIGIEMQTSSPVVIVKGNTVRNMTAGALTGIFVNTGNPNPAISQNTVYALSSTNVSNSLSVRGLYVITSGSANIEKNLIHSLSALSPFQTINGIQVQSGTSTIKNNMIRLGLDTSGNSMNTGCNINGIYETGGANNFYFNSVYVGGTVSSGTASSYAFQSTVTNNTRNFLNNIFYNARTNNSSAIKHYAIKAGGSGVNPPGLNCNYNILFAPNTGGMIGSYNSVDYADLSSWRAATGQDNNSLAGDPKFINAAGSASLFNLHINNNAQTPVEQKGILISSVTDDFDGETRSSLTPTDIGADAGNFIREALAGDYAVGLSGVYPSITAALNDLYSAGASGPVRFILRDSNYTSETLPLTITAYSGASPVNTLTIKPSTGVTSVISGNNSTAVFDINNGSYFILDGSNTNGGNTKNLTVANASSLAPTIRFINDANNNIIKNSILKGVSGSAANGVVFFSTTNKPSGNDSNLILNNDITRNTTSPVFCIYNNGTGTSSATKNSANRIIGNRCFDFLSRGIVDEGNSIGNLYEGNEIYSVAGQSGIQVGCRIVGTTIEGFTFRNNHIHDLKTSSQTLIYGFEVNSLQSGSTGEVYNNMISLSEPNSNDIRGIVETSASDVFMKIYYNSVNISGTVTGTKNSDGFYTFGNSNTVFLNNILVNSRNGGSGKHYSIRTVSPLTNFNCNYNDIYAGGGTGNVFGRLNTTDIINLADWKTATSKDLNSVSADPKFISNTNLHIDSTAFSPVNAAGTTVAGITKDFDGDTRDISAPDIGADEFNPVSLSINLNLTMLIEGFYNAGTNLQASDTVKAYLRNSISPFGAVDSAKAVVSDSGKASLTFNNSPGGSYYIEILHRNSIETWSANAVPMTQGGSSSYNFATASSQAFGNNMRQVDNSPVRFAIYSGDVNQDGNVDAQDLSLTDNDVFIFVSGYVNTDLTGNNVTDAADLAIADNNAFNFVSRVRP